MSRSGRAEKTLPAYVADVLAMNGVRPIAPAKWVPMRLDFLVEAAEFSGLSAAAHRIAGKAIGTYMHAKHGGVVFVANATIAVDLALSTNAIREGWQALVRAGLFAEFPEDGRSTVYLPIWPNPSRKVEGSDDASKRVNPSRKVEGSKRGDASRFRPNPSRKVEGSDDASKRVNPSRKVEGDPSRLLNTTPYTGTLRRDPGVGAPPSDGAADVSTICKIDPLRSRVAQPTIPAPSDASRAAPEGARSAALKPGEDGFELFDEPACEDDEDFEPLQLPPDVPPLDDEGNDLIVPFASDAVPFIEEDSPS